jgi:hypothetical protein
VVYELRPDANDVLLRLLEQTKDLGDIPVSGDLERDQPDLAESIALSLSAAIGKGHSGSPFRQSILRQSERCRQYVVACLLEARLVPEHGFL